MSGGWWACRWQWPLLAGVLLAAPGDGTGGRAIAWQDTIPSYTVQATTSSGSAPFAVIGDLQRTMAAERLLFRESNPAERVALVRALEVARPAFLVIVGDLTNDGGSEREWQYFDGLTAGLRRDSVAFVPVVGNHDYWFHRNRAIGKLAARFDQLGRSTWYSRIYGRLALVVLDANSGELTRAEWEMQQVWFRETLERYQQDTSVSGILVFTHQPPYTNGTATSDDKAVAAAFLPSMARAGKVLAMISGHTHAYEHFEMGGRQFIVTGGGGGPRVGLRTGRDRHRDLFTGPAPRPFHFLWMIPEPWGVRVEVDGLDKGETATRTIDRFDLRW